MLISQQAHDDARTTLQSKQASYDSALQSARNLRASIQASEAAMKLAGRQLRDTEIRAAFDGFVEKRLVNLGVLVKSQMLVMAIVRLDPLKVTAEMPERMAPWISNGRPVELHVDVYRDRTFTGTVTRISSVVNADTRAFPFEAVVPNPDAALKPGTFVRVHVESGKVDDVLTLPYAPVHNRMRQPRLRRQGRPAGLARAPGGRAAGDRVEITSGVKEGERVAITDVDTLTDGALVVVTASRSRSVWRRSTASARSTWWGVADTRSTSSWTRTSCFEHSRCRGVWLRGPRERGDARRDGRAG